MLEYMFTWLRDYTSKKNHTVIGLMSGTSLDGIDAACVEIRGSGENISVRLREFVCVPFEDAVRARIFESCGDTVATGAVARVARLNFELGELFADAALQVLNKCGLQPADVSLIGSHGQTISHLPPGGTASQSGVTLQIGEPCVIAERTGITTVADFRVRDMAAGGQGAPLVPYVDYLLLRHATRNRIVQNIGGIANLTWLPAGGGIEDVQAFDSGPGNMVMDECVRLLCDNSKHFDEDGAMAAHGAVDEEWLSHLLQHEYLQRKPPKTAGREEFGAAYARDFVQTGKARHLSDNAIIATATALTARSIAAGYRLLSTQQSATAQPTEIILGGGGAFNPTLRRMIAQATSLPVLTHEDVGIRSDAKEAIAFAVLAHEATMGNATNVIGATGARRRAVLGKIVPGRES